MGPLVATKVSVPRRRRGLVSRPRLVERLGRGDEAALHGLLQKVRDTGLPLLSVTRLGPDPREATS